MPACGCDAVILLGVDIAAETPGKKYSRQAYAFSKLNTPGIGQDALFGTSSKTKGDLDAFSGLRTGVRMWEGIDACGGVVERCEGKKSVCDFGLDEAQYNRVEKNRRGWNDITKFLDIQYCWHFHGSKGQME